FQPTAEELSVLGDPHPIQGFHVKLTVNTGENTPGGHKYKVFWIQPCTTTPGTVTGGGGGGGGGGTETGGTGTNTGGPTTVLGERVTRSPSKTPAKTPANVLGTSATRAP